MQAQATITLPPELESELRTMVRQTVSEMLQQQSQAQKDAPDFMNLGQAADYIHLSRATLNKLIKRGDIHVTFIGAAKRISKQQLIKYMSDKAI